MNHKEYTSLNEIIYGFSSSEVSVISFDIFDTLLLRPMEHAEDVYRLLDRYFEEQQSAFISFQKLRTEAEAVLRRKIIHKEWKREDVHLEDIYQVLVDDFGMDSLIADSMMKKELELEFALSLSRKSGQVLYQKAKETGKKVILISDMYLSKEQIQAMLEKNGYEKPDAIFVSSDCGLRKITGNLYKKVLQTMGVEANQLFHIGDNIESDCNIPAKLGIQVAWLPGCMYMYEQYGCAHQVEKICGDLTNWEVAKQSVGIRIMRGLAANKYFDDPFRTFEKESDYNQDPYFVGYGALGMELLALTKWMVEQIKRDHVENMVFLARDGYLPKKAYDMYRQYHKELPSSSYLHLSRISMLPAMIKAPKDLFDLPMDIVYQSPRKLLKLLSFCVKDEMAQYSEEAIWGIPMDEAFTKDSYIAFITHFVQNLYDEKKHREMVAHIGRALCENSKVELDENCALFDMGYSGRIPAAIVNATNACPNIYYFHSDARDHFRYEKRTGLKLRNFFDFNPYMESSLREYSYLEPVASCIGYGEDYTPMFDIGPADGYKEAVLEMQKGALDFVADYLQYFSEYESEADFRYHDGAMPFEAFLRYCSSKDRVIYQNVLIDDELWGGRRDIELKDLMEIRLRKIPDYAKERVSESDE